MGSPALLLLGHMRDQGRQSDAMDVGSLATIIVFVVHQGVDLANPMVTKRH